MLKLRLVLSQNQLLEAIFDGLEPSVKGLPGILDLRLEQGPPLVERLLD